MRLGGAGLPACPVSLTVSECTRAPLWCQGFFGLTEKKMPAPFGAGLARFLQSVPFHVIVSVPADGTDALPVSDGQNLTSASFDARD